MTFPAWEFGCNGSSSAASSPAPWATDLQLQELPRSLETEKESCGLQVKTRQKGHILRSWRSLTDWKLVPTWSEPHQALAALAPMWLILIIRNHLQSWYLPLPRSILIFFHVHLCANWTWWMHMQMLATVCLYRLSSWLRLQSRRWRKVSRELVVLRYEASNHAIHGLNFLATQLHLIRCAPIVCVTININRYQHLIYGHLWILLIHANQNNLLYWNDFLFTALKQLGPSRCGHAWSPPHVGSWRLPHPCLRFRWDLAHWAPKRWQNGNTM